MSNLLKVFHVQVDDTEKRVIDANQLFTEKIEQEEARMQNEADGLFDDTEEYLGTEEIDPALLDMDASIDDLEMGGLPEGQEGEEFRPEIPAHRAPNVTAQAAKQAEETRSLSNMIKRAFVKVEGTEKLMIDSNGLINDKMEEFSVADSSPEFVQFDAEGSGEFTEGLMADKVEMLVGEGQGEGEGAEALSPSNVLKNGPSPDVEQLLAQAREEAQGIIDEAEARAAGIVSEAEQNAAATLENAKNEGFSAGHDEGYQA